jgi:hypothetical protein
VDPSLCLMNPLYTLPPYFFKIHSIIILPSTPSSSKSSSLQVFWLKILYASHLSHLCYTTLPPYSP